MAYTWTPPTLAKGDRASFQDGHHRLYQGVCMGVETRYDTAGTAYHVYAMRPDNCKRLHHIGGETITRLERPSYGMAKLTPNVKAQPTAKSAAF